MNRIDWKQAHPNEDGIYKIGFKDLNESLSAGRIVGFNGIIKGNKVLFKEKTYFVVMVSRLGHFGLSENEEGPYDITAKPKDVKKIID